MIYDILCYMMCMHTTHAPDTCIQPAHHIVDHILGNNTHIESLTVDIIDTHITKIRRNNDQALTNLHYIYTYINIHIYIQYNII